MDYAIIATNTVDSYMQLNYSTTIPIIDIDIIAVKKNIDDADDDDEVSASSSSPIVFKASTKLSVAFINASFVLLNAFFAVSFAFDNLSAILSPYTNTPPMLLLMLLLIVMVIVIVIANAATKYFEEKIWIIIMLFAFCCLKVFEMLVGFDSASKTLNSNKGYCRVLYGIIASNFYVLYLD